MPYPGDPSIQMPNDECLHWAQNSLNSTYFGLFGSLRRGFRNQGVFPEVSGLGYVFVDHDQRRSLMREAGALDMRV